MNTCSSCYRKLPPEAFIYENKLNKTDHISDEIGRLEYDTTLSSTFCVKLPLTPSAQMLE
ncbi:8793_t:CDS:2 [Dentiscutata erythropus]|uniref:8793_t:CDS:1 n=1 Tax=Dentiscutata erythropus TaxID=1348616 RepID=A0A9N8W4A0_9GLOM|nr:8793_t:CDS:2 [Dentiscutata erythropus]